MKVLTANSLDTGEALFWNKGQWKVRFADGEHFTADEDAAPFLAEAEAQPKVVVAPYLIDVEEIDGHWFPIAFRERLRALGPTNHPQHGKQAEGADLAALTADAARARSTGRLTLIKRH